MTIIADQDNLAEPLTREETLLYVRDKQWKAFRARMRGQPLEVRKGSLLKWLEANDFNRASRVQIGHYIQALKTAGVVTAGNSKLKSKHS